MGESMSEEVVRGSELRSVLCLCKCAKTKCICKKILGVLFTLPKKESKGKLKWINI